MSEPAPLTLGTAGHIDHGKTALIAALTGTDTDRLPQEKARGISIELGYAPLTLPSGRRLSVIDVPGHERLVRTMVAGATGIDLFLMVVAADDGVMPQTREHARVLRALAIDAGAVAITKTDVANPDRAAREASDLIPGARVVPVSVRTGAGLTELLAVLDEAAGAVRSRSQTGGEQPARLHVDRVFTIRGAGTVVTGTLWSGSVGRADELQAHPHDDLRVRVRGVQVHDDAVERAVAGQRVALNLTGPGVRELVRGDVLATADRRGDGIRSTYLIDAALQLAEEPGGRVQVHHGTRDAAARLAWLGGDFFQLRLEQALVPAAGDRLVIRRIAPPDTLGGGVVLDPHPRKHGPSRETSAHLQRLLRGERAHLPPAATRDATATLPPSRTPRTAPELSASALALEQQLKETGVEPPLDSELDPADLAALREAGRAVRVSKTLHYHPEVLEEIRRRIITLGRRRGSFTLADVRDELQTSRKFAQALLEHFDSERLTLRRGEVRVLRGSGGGRSADV
jgi:selenocysteine-specific elongation factor